MAAQRRGPTCSRSIGTESALISKGLTKVMATVSASGSSAGHATKVTAVAALVMPRSTMRQPDPARAEGEDPALLPIASAIGEEGRGQAAEEHDLGPGIAGRRAIWRRRSITDMQKTPRPM